MSRDRALRKQQQLNNLVAAVTKLAKPGDVIVDFCSGGGHVGIVLAYMMPSCQVVLIENKELSLIRAKDRSDELGLKNIWFIQANLDYFNGTFNIGVALHACGVATDMVIEHCLRARAAFVISPCCYGFIQNTVKFKYPRSHQFKEILSYKEHMILCRFADQTAVHLPPERRLIGRTHQGDAPVGNCDAVYSKDFPTALLQAAKPVFSKKRGGEGALFGQMPKRLLGASDGQEKQNQRKRRGGAVDSRLAQKRSRLLPSSAGGTSQAELIDLEESGTLSFEPAGEEIIDLTGESPEPEVIDITGKSPEPEVNNIEVTELKIIVIGNDESAGEEEQSQQQPHCYRESENLAEPLARDDEEEPRENYGERPASVYSSPLWLDENSRDWVQSLQPSHLSRPAENSAGLLMTGGEEEPRGNDGVQPAGPATPPAREDANAEVQDREQRQQHPPGSSAADNSAELWASDNVEEPRDNDGSIESSDWPETVESPSTSEDDTTEDWEEFQLYPFGSRSGGNSPELLPSNLLQEPRDIEFEWPTSVYSSPLRLDESSRDWVQSLQPSRLSRPAENSAGLLMTGGEEEPRGNDGEQPGHPATPPASQNANAELLEVHEQQRRNVTLNSHEQVDGSGIEPAANDAHVADPAPAEQESNQEETTHSDAQPGVVIRCPICFEFYSEIMQNGQQLVATLCGHVFCSRCLPVALENTNMCPTCRVELDPDLYIPIYL